MVVGLGGMGGFMQELVPRQRYIRINKRRAATLMWRGMDLRGSNGDDVAMSFAEVLKQVKSLLC